MKFKTSKEKRENNQMDITAKNKQTYHNILCEDYKTGLQLDHIEI